MYPIFRLASTMIRARFRPKLEVDGKSKVTFRAWPSDVDLFLELNNARYLNFMELGRWDLSRRTGFLATMKSNNWGVAVGGASIRYRRRIPVFCSFTVTSSVLCHDGRWFYFLQEFHRGEQICASALMKVCATSKEGLVPAPDVAVAMGEEMSPDVPDWVQAWIDAEGKRPWPSKVERPQS
jgi:acyl-CoA thioesterase FadM